MLSLTPHVFLLLLLLHPPSPPPPPPSQLLFPQVHWHGYPGTLGRELVDYFAGDATSSPPELRSSFLESLLLLPFPYLANSFPLTYAQGLSGNSYTSSRCPCIFPLFLFPFLAYSFSLFPLAFLLFIFSSLANYLCFLLLIDLLSTLLSPPFSLIALRSSLLPLSHNVVSTLSYILSDPSQAKLHLHQHHQHHQHHHRILQLRSTRLRSLGPTCPTIFFLSCSASPIRSNEKFCTCGAKSCW